MLKKSYALALAVTTAGLIGFAAPVASAATMSFAQGGPSASIVSAKNNQLPLQACGNDANANSGAGTQTTTDGGAVVRSLLSPGSETTSNATDNRSCDMANKQSGDAAGDSGPSASFVDMSNNQLPVQACGNDLNTNSAGGTQNTMDGVSGAMALLSPAAITEANSTDNRSCGLVNKQGGWDW